MVLLRRVLRLSVGLSVGLSTSARAQAEPDGLPGSAITADGRYVVASVRKTNSPAEVPTLVIRATHGSWRQEIPGGSNPRLLPDSKALLWQRGDTLWRLTLGASVPRVVATGVRAYGLLGRAPGGPWLVYRPREADEALIVRQLATGRERRFADVSGYVVAPDEHVLLLWTTAQGASVATASGVAAAPAMAIAASLTKANSTMANSDVASAAAAPTAAPASAASSGTATTAPSTAHITLRWVALPSGAERPIWTGLGQLAGGSAAITFDPAGRQLVFVVETPRDSSPRLTLWHYAAGSPEATVLVEAGMPGLEPGFTLTERPARFSASGRRVFVQLREPARPQPPLRPDAVDLWSYTDALLQSQQLVRLAQRRAYAAVVLLPERRVMRLEQDMDVLLGTSSDEHALVCTFDHGVIRLGGNGEASGYTMDDYNWSRAAQCSVTLVRLRDGARTVLRAHLRNTSSTFPYYRLSPGGRFVVFYDPWRKEYGSYELASGVTRPLTRGLSALWEQEDLEGGPRDLYRPVGIRGWLPGEAAVMVADHYFDLWRLDLTGREPPVNLTTGYARRQQLRFHWQWADPAPVLDRRAGLLVKVGLPSSARRLASDGWYRVRLDRAAEPQALVPLGGLYRYTNLVLGARGGDTVYVATRESLTEAPGTWYTRDFRTWTPVTDGRPEQRRPWPRQLLTWKTFDGHEAQGMLWLPRDFDPRRKYPVITYIYENLVSSSDIGRFIPENSGRGVREWTDAGYLVFNPNIHYTIGATGESVYNVVAAGAQHLATLPFVDSHRLGLQGRSFGGFETNYLLTRTSIFAAAYSSSGVSNFLSFYGTEEKDPHGYSYMASAQTGQNRLGVTPWEQPEVYLRNSPVFHADKITTPLLLGHNYDDYRVPFSQSMELYKALRRLGKPVWLVAGYGGHVGLSEADTRARQFFDHYLKGAPAPRWMTRGIPAARRGVETGLELDTTVAGPGPGLLDTSVRTPLQERLPPPPGRRE